MIKFPIMDKLVLCSKPKTTSDGNVMHLKMIDWVSICFFWFFIVYHVYCVVFQRLIEKLFVTWNANRVSKIAEINPTIVLNWKKMKKNKIKNKNFLQNKNFYTWIEFYKIFFNRIFNEIYFCICDAVIFRNIGFWF